MEFKYLIEQDAINISIQRIAMMINEKMEKYNRTKDENLKKELIQLIKDRDLVYSNDKLTIEKYI